MTLEETEKLLENLGDAIFEAKMNIARIKNGHKHYMEELAEDLADIRSLVVA